MTELDCPMTVYVYVCGNENRIWWEANVCFTGQPMLAGVRAVCWRKYKTKEGALRAGLETCKRLFPNAEVLG